MKCEFWALIARMNPMMKQKLESDLFVEHFLAHDHFAQL